MKKLKPKNLLKSVNITNYSGLKKMLVTKVFFARKLNQIWWQNVSKIVKAEIRPENIRFSQVQNN